MATVRVDVASEAERGLIEQLFQFYVYDFSEMEPVESEDFEPGPDGRFSPFPFIEPYWRDATRTPLLIRRGDRVAGFALINTLSHRNAALDWNMAEFFVMRKYRRAGVGVAAVAAILPRFPGRWEIAVAARNAGARLFWPRAVAAAPGVRDLTVDERSDDEWRGPILCFTSAP